MNKLHPRDILFISFDAPRPDYQPMPYGIATLIAAVQNAGFTASHYQINIESILTRRHNTSEYVGPIKSERFKDYLNEIKNLVNQQIEDIIPWIFKFKHVAFTYTRWSKDYCEQAAEILWMNDYVKEPTETGGIIIFGGYEITAYNDIQLAQLDMAHYFIRGYGEKSVIKILKGEEGKKLEPNSSYPYHRVFEEKICDEDIVSPYLTGVLNTLTRKVYWETKRGCPYRCGFCEWGAQSKKERNPIVELNWDRLREEIDLFARSGVEEINILDGTFCFSKGMLQHLNILMYILEKTDIKITCQARFEALKLPFIKICNKYYKRIHLEFGLQTIHKLEMDTIGRKNNCDIVRKKMALLNSKKIAYEISIIYAIPGQTMRSFIDTIEFCIINGCKKIKAFPLQISANSELAKQPQLYTTKQEHADTLVKSVHSSESFDDEDRYFMNLLAERLDQTAKCPYDNVYAAANIDKDGLKKAEEHEYQYNISKEFIMEMNEKLLTKLIYLINRYFVEVLKKQECTELEQIGYDPKRNDYTDEQMRQFRVDVIDMLSRKVKSNGKTMQCNIIIGESGNFYVIPMTIAS